MHVVHRGRYGEQPWHGVSSDDGKKKLYNVKKGVWHNLIATPNTILLIVENSSTSSTDSDYYPVTADLLPED